MKDVKNNVECPKCKVTLKLNTTFNSSLFEIYSCKCESYPALFGIFYMVADARKDQALKLIKAGKFLRAFVKLLDLNKRLKLLYTFLFYPHLVNRYLRNNYNKSIGQYLGFKKCVQMCTYLGYPKSWAYYLLNRRKMPSFEIARSALSLIKTNSTILDLGCGTGHLFSEIQKKSPKQLIGIDRSFVHLLLAKMFFSKDATLIVLNIEKGLPFTSQILDHCVDTDSFHYLRNKRYVFQELSRVIKPTGNVTLLHIMHVSRGTDNNIYPVSQTVIEKLSYVNNFFCCTIAETILWKQLLLKKRFQLEKSDIQSISQSDHYSCFLTKQRRSIVIDSSIAQKHLLNLINYYQDPSLQNVFFIHTYVRAYKEFIFISPHLDDAVLSCGSLLDRLHKLGKTITVITVFTKVSSPPYTPLAKEFTQQSGFKNPVKLFEERKKEDKKALKLVSAKIVHLDFTDAAWRKSLLGHIYPLTKKQFSGHFSLLDVPLKQEIKKQLNPYLSQKESLIFGPLGIGGHADHILIKDILKESNKQTIFWSDYPYNRDKSNEEQYFRRNRNFRLVSGLLSNSFKRRLVLAYNTQRRTITTKKIHQSVEKYYKLY